MSYGILDNNPSSYNNEEYLARNEAQRHIKQLEKGLVVLVLNSRRRIMERLTLRPNRQTKELLCLRCETAPPEVAISLREIQEVRHGKEGPDFERMSEEARDFPAALCVAIMYGSEFMLSSLSFVTDNTGEFEVLTKGLKQLMAETKEGTYHDEKAAWLHGQFYKVCKLDSHWVNPGKELRAKVSDVKLWLSKSWKMKPKEMKKVVHPSGRLSEDGEESRDGDHVSFRHFSDMFQRAAHAEKLISEHFQYYMEKEDKQKKMKVENFKRFLKDEQKETRGDVEQKAIMAKWVDDSLREVNGLYFLAHEFEDFIFSQENSIWNPVEKRVNQAMTHPLTDYFIASSHNTYVISSSQLTGDASVEAYVRALLMGCRCVELDCFDGPDGPIIKHGKTPMTAIKAIDVLNAVKKYAWKTSEYPVILSIENHMSMDMQKVFAQQMKDTFKEMLLTKTLDTKGNKMPSPHDLRRKIIIKDKKFGKDQSADAGMDKDDHRAGIVEVYDTEEEYWVQHSAVLTYTALMLSKVRKEDVSAQSISEEDLELSDIEDDLDEDVVTQPWFHGKLDKKDVKEKLEPNAAMMGDGYFLVRESMNSDGYTVSFWFNKEIKHARITMRETSDGSLLFSLGSKEFPRVKDLIQYHREHELILTKNIRVVLKDHCPFFPDYTTQEWFFEHLTRTEADALLQASKDGNFLVRPGSDASTFSISVRNDAKIRHFQIKREGRRFTIGNYQFSSMVKLVEFFRKRPIAKNLILGVPLQRDLLGEADMACKIYDSCVYADPMACGDAKVIVRALFDFTTKNPDHLSFKRGAIIYNVTADDSLWWRGELGGETGLFPARNVEVVRHVDEEEEETLSLSLDSLETDTPRHHKGRENIIRVTHPNLRVPLYVGVQSTLDLRNWLVDIGYCRDLLNKKRDALEQQSTQFQRALEWSELIVYCRSVKLKTSEGEKGDPGECVSLKDTELRDYTKGDKQAALIKHHQRHLSRVYPSSGPIRLTQSTNYDPMPCWNLGCQMVALNYQTLDVHMQRNVGFFTRNGRCGYVLKPECMRKPEYNPSSCLDNDNTVMTVKVLAGRLLGAMNVFVEMQVTGAEIDNADFRTSKNSGGNALHALWSNETQEFSISFPELALLRFEVKSDQNEQSLGQACIPVPSIRPGFRCVPLLYPSGDPMGLPALLVYVSFKDVQASEEANVNKVIEGLRKELASLEKHDKNSKRYQKLKEAEQNMLSYLEKRSQRKKSVGVRK